MRGLLCGISTGCPCDGGRDHLIAYADDVHTGLDARRNGWRLVIYRSRSPPACARTTWTHSSANSTHGALAHQYRPDVTVVDGADGLRARLTYVSGFFYYLQTALATFVVPLIRSVC